MNGGRQAAPAGGVPAQLLPTLTRISACHFLNCSTPTLLPPYHLLIPAHIAVSTLANRTVQIGSLQGAAQLFSKGSGSVSGILADVVTPARSAVAASFSRFDQLCMPPVPCQKHRRALYSFPLGVAADRMRKSACRLPFSLGCCDSGATTDCSACLPPAQLLPRRI